MIEINSVQLLSHVRFFATPRTVLKILRYISLNFSGTSGKESACQCRIHKGCRFNAWVAKMPGNPIDRGAWWARVHRVTKSCIWLKWLSTEEKQMYYFSSGSVAQSCLTLCELMDFSMLGLPVHHQPLEFTQTHVHWVSDVIQPSHPLSNPSLPAFNLSQHQGLF